MADMDVDSAAALQPPVLAMDRINEFKSQLRIGVRFPIDRDSQFVECMLSYLEAQKNDTLDDSCQIFLNDVVVPFFVYVMTNDQLHKWPPEFLVDFRHLFPEVFDMLIPCLDSDCLRYLRLSALLLSFKTCYHRHTDLESCLYAAEGEPFADYLTNQADPSFGYLIDACNLFGAKGGYAKLLEIAQNPESSLVKVFLAAFCTFASGLLPTNMCRQQFVYPIFDILCERVANTSTKELKPQIAELIKDGGVLVMIREARLVMQARTDIDWMEKVDVIALRMSDELLRVQSFNATMYALDEIKAMMARAYSQQHNPRTYQSSITIAGLADWVVSKELLKLLLSDNLHKSAYVHRVEEIVKLLISSRRLSLDDLDLIWSAQEGKHGMIVTNVHDMLARLAYRFDPDQLDRLFGLVKASWGGSEQNMERLLHLVQRLAEEDVAGSMANKVMQLVWSLAHNPDTSAGILDLAISAMIKVLEGRMFHDTSGADVNTWLQSCIVELRDQRWVLPALRMTESLLSLLPSNAEPSRRSQRDTVLGRIMDEGLQDTVLDFLERYQGMAKEHLATLANEEDLQEHIIFEQATHHALMAQLRQLLHFITQERDSYLSDSEAIRLWELLVEKAPSKLDQEQGLIWFSQVLTPEPDIEASTQRYLLTNKLLAMDLETMPLTAVKCVQAIFFNINAEDQVLDRDDANNLRVHVPNHISNLESLWALAVTHVDESIADVVILSLIEVFTGLMPHSHGAIINDCLDKVRSTLAEEADAALVERKAVRGLTILHRYLNYFDLLHDALRFYPIHAMSYRGSPCTVNVVPVRPSKQAPFSLPLESTTCMAVLRKMVSERMRVAYDRVQLSFGGKPLDNNDGVRCLSMAGMYDGCTVNAKSVADSRCSAISMRPNLHREEALASFILSRAEAQLVTLRQFLASDSPSAVQDAAMRILISIPCDFSLQHFIFSIVCSENGNMEELFADPGYQRYYSILTVCSLFRPANEDTFSHNAVSDFHQHFWQVFSMDLLLGLLDDFGSLQEEANTFRYEMGISALRALLVLVQDVLEDARLDAQAGMQMQTLTPPLSPSKPPQDQASAEASQPSHLADPLGARLSSAEQARLLDVLLRVFVQLCDPAGLGAYLDSDTATYNQPAALDIIYLFKLLCTLSSSLQETFLTAWTKLENLRLLTLQCPFKKVRQETVDLLCSVFADVDTTRQDDLWRASSQLLEQCQDLQGICACDDFFNMFSRIVQLLSSESALTEFDALLQGQIMWLLDFCQKPQDAEEMQGVLAGRLKLSCSIVPKLKSLPEALDSNFVLNIINALLFPSGRHLLQLKSLSELPQDLGLAASICTSRMARKEAFNFLSCLVSKDLSFFEDIVGQLKELHYRPEYAVKDFEYLPVTEPRETASFVGLKNASATCYMNSILQQVFMQPDARDLLLGNLSSEEQDDNFMHQVARMVAHLQYSNRQFYTPHGLWKTYRHWGAPVNVREQQDACEFFNCLIDQVDEGLKSIKRPQVLFQIFGGMFVDQKIIKSGCKHRYERDEPFTTIPITIRNCKNLLQALDNYVQGELLEGANAYKCEECDAKRDTIKRTCIKTLPRVLALQLKRFDYDWERGVPVKFNDYFEFPDELDMGPYTAEGKAAIEDGIGEVPHELYRLSGVVVHSGQANGGHYYSYIRAREQTGSSSETWYKFDDHEVTPITYQGVSTMASDWFGGETTSNVFDKQLGRTVPRTRERWWNAYMLFYERVNAGHLKLKLPESSENEKQELEYTELDRIPCLRARINVIFDNIVWAHEREIFNAEYFDFVQHLVERVSRAVAMQDANAATTASNSAVLPSSSKTLDASQRDTLVAHATELGISFLVYYGLMTDDSIRADLDPWPQTFRRLFALSNTARELFRDACFAEERLTRLLVFSTDEDARDIFMQIVFECVHATLLFDGQEAGMAFMTRITEQLRDYYKKFGSYNFLHLKESFELLVKYCQLGSNYRRIIIDMDLMHTLLAFLQLPGDTSHQHPHAFRSLVSLVCMMIMSMDFSPFYSDPGVEGVDAPHFTVCEEDVGGTTEPLPLIETIPTLLMEHIFVKQLLERYHDHPMLLKMLQFACYRNKNISTAVVLAANHLADHAHHYDMHPYLKMLRRVFGIEDSLQVYRFQLSCEAGVPQYVGLFRIMEFCKDQFHKKSYFVAKLLAWAMEQSAGIKAYLLSDHVYNRWAWFPRWLDLQINSSDIPPQYASHEDYREYHLERTDSALDLLANLQQVCATNSSAADDISDDAMMEEDIGDDKNKLL
eukprot:m.59150 g.59150  ORF g.59150 m.59150 type:complete len:2271 (+) comp13209_c0_seq2:2748-9560(+)